MFEGNKPLKVERVRSKDPLFLLSCPVPYVEAGNELIGTVRPVFSWHFFKAKAKKANSDVVIKVTDRFGRSYSQTMHRPKAMTLSVE